MIPKNWCIYLHTEKIKFKDKKKSEKEGQYMLKKEKTKEDITIQNTGTQQYNLKMNKAITDITIRQNT